MSNDDEMNRFLMAMKHRDEHMEVCTNGCDAMKPAFCAGGRILDRQVSEELRTTLIAPQGLPVYYSMPPVESE